MKLGWVVLVLLLLCAPAFAQEARSARATYAGNGRLIGLADLAPLRDCSIRVMEGKVKSMKAKGGLVIFDLKEKRQRATFQFPLNRLASSEQSTFQKDFLHNGLRLRANGYACSQSDDPLEAISIDRVY